MSTTKNRKGVVLRVPEAISFSRRTDCLRNDLNTVDMPLKNKTMIFFLSTGKSTKYNLVVDHERFCTLQQHLLYIFKNFRPKKSKPQG